MKRKNRIPAGDFLWQINLHKKMNKKIVTQFSPMFHFYTL